MKLINDRIAVIRFDLEEKGQLTVINVYGPTSVNTALEPELGRRFYTQVQAVYSAEKVKSALLFFMGDFNSKIDMRAPTDSDFTGRYWKRHGGRNENGTRLKELAEGEGLYLINTHFKL